MAIQVELDTLNSDLLRHSCSVHQTLVIAALLRAPTSIVQEREERVDINSRLVSEFGAINPMISLERSSPQTPYCTYRPIPWFGDEV